MAAIGQEREKVTTMSVDMSMEFSTHDDEESMSSSHNEEEHDISSFRSFAGMTQLGSPPSALRELPTLWDAPPNKREELFKLKLQLCGTIFSSTIQHQTSMGRCVISTFSIFFCLNPIVMICNLCFAHAELTANLDPVLCVLSSTTYIWTLSARLCLSWLTKLTPLRVRRYSPNQSCLT